MSNRRRSQKRPHPKRKKTTNAKVPLAGAIETAV